MLEEKGLREEKMARGDWGGGLIFKDQDARPFSFKNGKQKKNRWRNSCRIWGE